MSGFTLILQSASGSQQIDNVLSFVGEDESGGFGLQPRHQRFMTSLVFGLARFRCNANDWQFLALPGGLLYFVDNQLTINCRRYLVDSDYERISHTLSEQMLKEEQQLRSMKESLRRMEEQMLRRLWQMRRSGGHAYEE